MYLDCILHADYEGEKTLQSLPGEKKIKRDEEVQLKHGISVIDLYEIEV